MDWLWIASKVLGPVWIGLGTFIETLFAPGPGSIAGGALEDSLGISFCHIWKCSDPVKK